MSPDDLKEVEVRSLSSEEHGREVFGNVRVPLFTMQDGYRGFPAFLKNNFVGTSLCQLIVFLITNDIISKEEFKTAITTSVSGT